MNSRKKAATAATAALVLVLMAGIALAQTPQDPQATPLGAAFTYQGKLEVSGAPYSGACDMIFGLYDIISGGTALGTVTRTAVPVDEGVFTAPLDFGASAFDGNARWLEIQVRCPAGGGTYQVLAPRQTLTATPYALYAARAANAWAVAGNAGTSTGKNYLGTSDNAALEIKVNAARVLRLEPNATSPNLLGGYSGNWLTAGVYGATVGGGGLSTMLNRVTDSAGTVGGGVNNQAGDNAGDPADKPAATVGGGSSNTASGAVSTVAGGYGNVAGGSNAAVGGGYLNTAGGDYAMVAGGSANAASGTYATVSGGTTNAASGLNATVGGGGNNTAEGENATVGGGSWVSARGAEATASGGRANAASGDRATVAGGHNNRAAAVGASVGGGIDNVAGGVTGAIGGGYFNTTRGDYATVGGGDTNSADSAYSTIPGGNRAKTTHYGEMAYASGSFSSLGDAQASLYVLRRETTSDGIWQDLYLDGSGTLLILSGNRTVTFDVEIAARSSGGESAGYHCWGAFELVGTITTPLGSSCWAHGEDDAAWDVRISVDQTYDALLVQVMGHGESIRWVAVMRTAEVSW